MIRHLIPALIFALVGSSSALAAQDLEGSLGQELERQVRLRAQLGEDADVHVSSVRIANTALASRATTVKRVALPTGEDGLGRVAAKVLLTGKDGSEVWTWVQAHVDASVPTVVAARSLERGSTMGAVDLELVMLPVHHQHVTLVGEPVGHVLKRAVRAGEPLRSTWFARPIAVKRGDRVETIVRRGAVAARGAAEAVERGRVGDIIRVKVAGSRRMLRARVLGDQQVEVIR
jgi:flagella basal body P-ring formation protein FlgA